MSRVTDYSSLQTAVGVYLKRADIGTSYIDYLLSEVEEELNSRMRARRMLTTVTPTVSAAGVVTLPSDFAGWKRFQVRDGAREWDLALKSAEQTTEVSSLYLSTGIPEALITTGSTSQIWPFTNSTYTFAGLYFAKIPQLTGSATTNWVVTNYPNAYLYGCLAAARGLASDDQPAGASRFDLWRRMFQHALHRIERDTAMDVDSRSNATLQADTSLFSGAGVYNVLADGYN